MLNCSCCWRVLFSLKRLAKFRTSSSSRYSFLLQLSLCPSQWLRCIYIFLVGNGCTVYLLHYMFIFSITSCKVLIGHSIPLREACASYTNCTSNFDNVWCASSSVSTMISASCDQYFFFTSLLIKDMLIFWIEVFASMT